MKSVPQSWLVLLMFLVFCHTAAGADAPSTHGPSVYFDSVSSVTSPPASFFIRVQSVEKGAAADRPGLRPGDLLIGFEGLRVRTLAEWYLLRFVYEQRPTLTFTIVRDGAIVDIPVSDPSPIRCIRSDMKGQLPDFIASLQAVGIPVDDLLPVPLPRGGVIRTNELFAALADVFLGSGRGTTSYSAAGAALAAFPARGQEAIAALTSPTNNAADREWVTGLLRVYGRLLFEKYDEAAKIIVDAKLLDRQPDPFLFRLLQFYKSVIEHPVSIDRGLPLDVWRVDVPFFSLCYPYPVAPEPSSYVFPADPAFQELFSKVLLGDEIHGRFKDDLSKAALGYAAVQGTDVERYMNQVKAAALDSRNHGGWPFRSSLIWSAEQSATMIQELKKRLEEHPEEQIEIGLCLQSPAMIAGDETTFRQALDMNFRAGPKVAALSVSCVNSTMSMRGNLSPGRWDKILAAATTNMPQPVIYSYLRRTSPAFRRRAALGPAIVWNEHHVEGFNSYCTLLPFVTAQAVETPLEEDRLANAVDLALRSDDPEVVKAAVDVLTFELEFNPQPRHVDCLLNLRAKVGAGRVFDSLRLVLARNTPMLRSTILPIIRLADLYSRFFGDVEKQYYRETAAELEKLDGKDPALPQKIATLYAKAGVPSVCLLLSRKLKEAGHAELAARYLRMATDFWDAAIISCPDQLPYTWPCRDLSSTSGFEDVFECYVSAGVLPASDATFVFRALLDSYRDEYDSVVRNLVQSVAPNLPKTEGPFLYKGDSFASVHYLRMQFLTDLLREHKFSDDQVAKLTAAPGLNMAAILETVGK